MLLRRSVLGGIKVYNSFFPTDFLEASMWFSINDNDSFLDIGTFKVYLIKVSTI